MNVASFIAGMMSVFVIIAFLILVLYAYAKKHNLIEKGDKKQ